MRTLLLFISAAIASPAATFKLLEVNPPNAHCGQKCAINILTSGAPNAADGTAILSDKSSWQVRVFRANGDAIPFSITRAEASSSGIGSSLFVDLSFDEAQLAGADPRTLRWSVLYQGAGDFQLKSQDPQPSIAPSATTKVLAAAPSRDKADIYFAGSVLAGVGTKPIYTLDAKVNLAPPIHWHDVRAGVFGEIQSNPSSSPPNDKSQIDPDSIRAAATINGLWKGLFWDIRPAGGEFSRKYNASNFVSSANLAWWTQSKQVPGGWFVVYPSFAVEAGVNLSKPAVIFTHPADLSRYNDIARAVPGINATYFVWGKKDKPRFTITGAYQARLLFTDEPFTQLQYYTASDGTRQRGKFVTMRDNTRHWVNGSATWALNDYFGFTAEYKYGSLPPLFELTQHQVTFGLVYKAALWPK